jgi:hypothetical protein
MSLAAIIAESVSVAATIPGIGVVHNHEFVTSQRSTLEANFMSGGVINCLEIDRERTPARHRTNRETERTHRIMFRFYFSAQEGEGSRATFRALVEAAEETFRPLYNLNGEALRNGPFEVQLDAYISKAGLTLHYAEGAMDVVELVT